MSCVRYPIGPRIGHQSQIEKGLIFRGLGLCRDTVQKKKKKKKKIKELRPRRAHDMEPGDLLLFASCFRQQVIGYDCGPEAFRRHG